MKARRIVITRPQPKAAHFAQKLNELGAEPIILPLIQIIASADPKALQSACHADYDWIIITSHNTVAQIGKYLGKSSAKIAAIGKASAQALQRFGLAADLIPTLHSAEGLFLALKQIELAGLRIFLPQGDLARPDLGNWLEEAGAQVTRAIAYHTICPAIDPHLLARPFDAITFTSPSTVHHFMETFPKSILGAALVACIGSVTAQAAHDWGLPVHGIANPQTEEGLIACLTQLFQRIPKA